MSNGIEVTKLEFNSSTLQPALEELKEYANGKLSAVSKEISQEILDNAKERCPVRTGFLRDSGQLVQTANGYEVVFTAPYALIVHERPNPSSGESQFLEKAKDYVCGENGENIKRRIDW